MRCFNCGNALPDDSQFCQYCGTDLSKKNCCKSCGASLSSEMDFCPKCGTHVGEEEKGQVIYVSEPVDESGFAEKTPGTLVEDTHQTDGNSAPTSNENAAPVVETKTTQEPRTPRPPKASPKRKWPLLLALGLVIIVGIGFFALRDGTTAAVTPAEAAENVLYLEVYDASDVCIGSGSGFLINDEMTLITNYHVVDGAYRMVAMTADGSRTVEVDSVIAYSEDADLAILKCKEGIGVSSLILADSDRVKQGDPVYAAGYPLGLANTLSDGIVSSKYSVGDVDILQITAPISSGSSGGALLNKQGQVIGVVRAYFPDAQNMNIAIAANEVSDLLSQSATVQSLEQLYLNTHPPIEFDEYYACTREIILPTEAMVDQFYEEWLGAGGTEDALIALMDEYATKDELIALMDEYAIEAGNGDLLFTPSATWKANGDLLSWIFDRYRRAGDIATFEVAWGHLVVYFSDAIKDGDYIGDTALGEIKKEVLSEYLSKGYITREEYEDHMKRLLSADVEADYHTDEYYELQHRVDAMQVDEYQVKILTISVETEAEAQKIYREWLAGAATEKSMASLMDKYGENQGGGMLHTVGRGMYVEEIEEWCFNGSRETGDVGIIENDYGYSICYFCGVVEKAPAFESLSNWVLSNYNTTLKRDGAEDKVYEEFAHNEGLELTRQIIACEGEDLICLRSILVSDSGRLATATLWLRPRATTFSCSYYDYVDSKDVESTFEGHGEIYAPSFHENSLFEFKTTSGDDTKIEEYQSYAQSLYYSSVAFAEYILSSYAAPEGFFCSMSDFGFYL